jgi:hypothetical protein
LVRDPAATSIVSIFTLPGLHVRLAGNDTTIRALHARSDGSTVGTGRKDLHAARNATQRQGNFVKISTMVRFGAGTGPHDRLLGRTADYARRIEAAGFPGIWVGDSMGGRPSTRWWNWRC